MSKDVWDRQWQIFSEALGKGPEERETFLAEACCGDEALRKEIDSLLETHDKDPAFLERPAVATASRQEPETPLRKRLQSAIGKTYVIRRRIGGGGMGDVYLVTHKTLEGKFVVKVLSSDLSRDPSLVSRFITEARIGAKLQHPNIVKVFDIGESEGFHYLVMNYVGGEDLAKRMERVGALPEKDVVSIAIQICRALECAHDNKIIHRDLKPSNVRIDTYGTVIVLDFGIARVKDQAVRTRTALGDRLGTPLYMSPEQVEGRPISPRSDFYSLGVMMYEMLTGTNPFEADSPFAIFWKQLHNTPPPVTEACPGVRVELSRIVSRLLEKNPESRYQSAVEIISDLRSLGLATEVRTPQPDSGISASEQGARFREDDLVRLGDASKAGDAISANERNVLHLVDGKRTVGQILTLSKLKVEEFTKALESLVEGGALETGDAGESATAEVNAEDGQPHELVSGQGKSTGFLETLPGLVRGFPGLMKQKVPNTWARLGLTAAALLFLGFFGVWLYSYFSPTILRVDAAPFAELEIMGQEGETVVRGVTPFQTSLSRGTYSVRFSCMGMVRTREIDLSSSDQKTIREDFWGENDISRLADEYLTH